LEEYFGYDYTGPGFELVGPGHLLTHGIVAGIVAYLVWGWRDPTETAKRRACWLIIVTIVVVELAWHAWNLVHDSWTIRYHLPLHLCSLSIIGSIYVLLTRHYRVYEIFFFIGIALVYVTAIEGLRPTWVSVWRTMLFANAYMAFVTIINYLIGSNYKYTLRKSDSASLLDLMGVPAMSFLPNSLRWPCSPWSTCRSRSPTGARRVEQISCRNGLAAHASGTAARRTA
jgi:uncharacterized membrane protein YwaF